MILKVSFCLLLVIFKKANSTENVICFFRQECQAEHI